MKNQKHAKRSPGVGSAKVSTDFPNASFIPEKREPTGFMARLGKPNRQRSQSGQALIVILAFSAILGAGLYSIYNTAQISAEKRELVNAADATAYSGAAILAQGLNYTAYTNRAILANNALIGQMTAMRSTLAMSQYYWKNNKIIFKVIAGLTRWIPYVGGVIGGMTNAVSKFSEFWGEKVIYPVQILAEVLQTSGTAAVSIANHAMWLSQQVQLADSVASFYPNMVKIAGDNAPDANIDPVLASTAFGPMVTLGSLWSKFELKKRSKTRTVGTKDAPQDKYLNYLTETNRGVATPAYLGGRELLPNAVGLWIATGCGKGGVAGASSGAFAPAAGFGGAFDTAVSVIDTFASLLSVVANPIMCLYERHGGSELIQLEDGKFAWTSIDAMAFKLPVLDIRYPMAGGAFTSFTVPKEFNQRYPDSIEHFRELLKGDSRLMAQSKDGSAKPSYFGNQVALPADCVEFLKPNDWDFYAVSTDTKISGTCAVLGVGLPGTPNKGMFGSEMRSSADKVLKSGVSSSTAAAGILNDLGNAAGFSADAINRLQAQIDAPNIPTPSGPTTSMPPGISGQVNASTTAGPNTQAMAAAGEEFASWSTVGAMVNRGLRNAVYGNPADFIVDPAGIITAAATSGPSAAGRDGGPNWWQRLLLRIGLGAFIDVDALIDMMRLKISDGIERPRNATLNNVFHKLADGLPPWFWDVKTEKPKQRENFGENDSTDLVYTDSNPQDYNERRYNLGPIVYLPLIKNTSKLKTTDNTGRGGSMMGLPDYKENRSGLRAIGKARIFFRQPSDQWLNRYKVVVNASLLLPYWQVRNESLSYVDKAGLLALDGLATEFAD